MTSISQRTMARNSIIFSMEFVPPLSFRLALFANRIGKSLDEIEHSARVYEPIAE